MGLEKVALFRGKTINEELIEGDLIQLDGYPYRFIQNGEGGNKPIVYGSEEVKIAGVWHPVSIINPNNTDGFSANELDRLNQIADLSDHTDGD